MTNHRNLPRGTYMGLTSTMSFRWLYNSYMKYVIRRKSSSAESETKQSDELGALRGVGAVGDLLLDRTDGPDASGVALLAEGGELGANGAAILTAGAPLHQAVGFEPVDELGDVGANAAQAAGEVAKSEWVLALHELLEGVELRDREADGSERFLEPVLQLLRGLENRDERALVGTRLRAAVDTRVQLDIVRIWNNTPDIQIRQAQVYE